MSSEYQKENIEANDLRQFAEIAEDVLRSTRYGNEYAASLLTITLCQGGANHYVVTHGYARRYLDPAKNGLKDIDIWFFFRKKGFHPQWHRKRDFGKSKFGRNPREPAYVGRRMDFYGRSIQFLNGDTVKSALERWLKSGRPKSSPWYLSQKAIVAIFPKDMIGRVLWVNPDLT